jgi:hypothetical protein
MTETNVGSLFQEIPLCEEDDVLCQFPEITQDWNDGDDQKKPPLPISSNFTGEANPVFIMDSSSSSLSTQQSAFANCDAALKMDGISIEPTPINLFGNIKIVKTIDPATHSMSEALFSNLMEILRASNDESTHGPSQSFIGAPLPMKLLSNVAFPPQIKQKGGSSLSRTVSVSSTASSSSEDKKSGAERWYDRFEDLKAFVKKHRHCHVPINYTPNLPLSKWTKRQRYQWKLKQDGKPSSMTDERQSLLEDLGFLWDVRHTVWDTRYHELVKFHKKHGYCNVSIGSEDYPKLGTWVKCQRRQYQLMKMGQKTHMTPLRVHQLNELGFLWKGKLPAQKLTADA